MPQINLIYADKDMKYGPQISRINTNRILVTLEKRNIIC